MIQQTITWTALPRGSDGPIAAGTRLRLSVFVAPRLWNDDETVTTMPLGDFPDWLDWPATIAAASFDVELEGGPTLPATVEGDAPRSDLWQALFGPETTVRPFVFEDLSGATLLSFDAATIDETIRDVYVRAATDEGYGGGRDLPDRAVLAADPDLADIAREVEPPPPRVPPETDRGPVHVGEKRPVDVGDGDGEPAGCLPPGCTPESLGCQQGCTQGCTGCLLWPFRLARRLSRRLLHWLRRRLGLGGGPSTPESGTPPESAGPEAGTGEGAAAPAPEAAADPPETGAEAARAEAGGPEAISARKQAFDDLHAYVQPHTLEPEALPTQEEIEEEYDFHRMVSTLGDYPLLMRRLGLVVDLVVTLGDELPDDIGTVRVVPTLPLATPTSNASPRTHYELGDGRFLARPRPGSELRDGLLRLDDAGRFRVVQADVAGSGLKLQNTATNVTGMEMLLAWPPNAPEEAGLPALQTAGISIVRPEGVAELRRRLELAWALNAFLAGVDGSSQPDFGGAGPPPEPTDELFADDLVRGYRLDVWDDVGGAWHSLCRRVGDYRFLDGPIDLLDEEDEGFVQMASTESPTDEALEEIRVHQSLFTWDGWSLVAPRPGRAILDPVDEDDPQTGNPPNEAVTRFQLETSFRPRSGSLPRLRFGWTYRVRARMVDLAGNSPFGPDAAAFADTQPEVTPEFRFGRYEPVAPPSLMLRTVPIEGESVEHLVVRSAIDDPPALVAALESERHAVPPKISQLMAERHEVFDGTPAIRTDAAAYDLASREAGSLVERLNTTTGALEPIPGTVADEDPAEQRVYWLQTNEQFEIAFLPDRFARGVLLLGLPGMASPDAVVDGVNRIAFSGTWPDLEAFRLRLVGLTAGTAPAQPSFDAVDRVLTVGVPQGESFRVRYSTFLDPATDLEKMGVWSWVEASAPPDLAELESRTAEGRNWLHMPFRELVLTHAVQQPLAVPVVDELEISPDREIGDTQVNLGGESHVDLDAKSTGKIDLRAAWTDPFDDPAKPSFNAATDKVDREMHVEELPVLDRTDDRLDLDGVVHTFGDTKYHRVTYTAIGTTRYREYFPPAVLADSANLVRPTPAEVGTPQADAARFVLDVPNSKRPEAVEPLYAVPAFSWSEADDGAGVVTRVRRGGGLRLYVRRPWFSSGAGELLGLVLRPPSVEALSADWKTLRNFVSEWGMDPLWRAAETAPLAESDFVDAVAAREGLSLAELPGLEVDVVGYEPQYDAARNLWFCDVAVGAERHYFPFLRLALARYQPISVDGAHLSRVVRSDFAQVLPHRTVRYDATQLAAGRVDIRVSGPAYFHRERQQFGSPLVVARVERRRFETGDELGWERVSSHPVPVDRQDPEETIWRGRLEIPSPAPSPLRIVVLEAEVYSVDPETRRKVRSLLEEDFSRLADGPLPSPLVAEGDLGFRVVFADAVELA